MARKLGSALAGLFALASAACSAPVKSAPAGELWTADATALPLQLERSWLEPAGVRSVELPQSGGADMPRRFVLGVPESLASLGPRPLVIFLHGAGGGRGLGNSLECLVAPAFARLAPIIVAPEAGRGEWWRAEETSLVLGLVDAAVRDWPVQADQVVVVGYSNGGIGAWFLARLYPGRISAAVPMASNHTIVGESPLPVFVIHGSRDDMFDVSSVKENIGALAARGFDVQLLVKPRGTHMKPCEYVTELQSAAAWLEGDVWRRPPLPADSETPGG